MYILELNTLFVLALSCLNNFSQRSNGRIKTLGRLNNSCIDNFLSDVERRKIFRAVLPNCQSLCLPSCLIDYFSISGGDNFYNFRHFV